MSAYTLQTHKNHFPYYINKLSEGKLLLCYSTSAKDGSFHPPTPQVIFQP